jgi:hypothetical protein
VVNARTNHIEKANLQAIAPSEIRGRFEAILSFFNTLYGAILTNQIMSNSISYLLGMLIAILGGTFFFVSYCSQCRGLNSNIPRESVESVGDCRQKMDFSTPRQTPKRTVSVLGAEIQEPRGMRGGSKTLATGKESEALPGAETKTPGI